MAIMSPSTLLFYNTMRCSYTHMVLHFQCADMSTFAVGSGVRVRLCIAVLHCISAAKDLDGIAQQRALMMWKESLLQRKRGWNNAWWLLPWTSKTFNMEAVKHWLAFSSMLFWIKREVITAFGITLPVWQYIIFTCEK